MAGDGDDGLLVESLVFRCLEASDRDAELDHVGREHPRLRDRVARLLARIDASDQGVVLAGAMVATEAASVGAATVAPDGGDRDGDGEVTHFGRFRLLRCLGRGGMGSVHLAWDQLLRREVALKQIRGDGLLSTQFRRRFAREAQAASRLDHPNLCTVYDSGEVGGVPFIAMQRVEGTPLESRIADALAGTAPLLPGMAGDRRGAGPLLPRSRRDFDLLCAFFATLADALHHAHQRGLVHRDVKPGNVMVTADGEPVVLDFGLVRDDETAEPQLTVSGAIMGSPPYMSPEQIAPGEHPVDRRTDTWALGVTLYQAVTGELPFAAPTLHELQKRILRAAPRRLRALNRAAPRDLEQIVATALDRDPSRRYATAAAMAADLRRLRAREPIRARRAGIGLRIGRWVQRNPVVAAFLLAISIGFAASLWQYLRAERSLRNFDQLASVRRLAVAERRAAQLYPPWPGEIDRLLTWQREHAGPLRREAAMVRAEHAALQARLLGHEHDPALDSERFLLDTLDDHLPQLTRFLDADDGTVADVQRRIDWARTLQRRDDDDHRRAWDRAIAAIAASEAYGGLELAPQIGLVPIGADPRSQLWEFWHLASAADGAGPPARDPDSGRLVITPDSGIVFVLVPPGGFWMGAVAQGERNVDPQVDADEAPVHRVELGAFFLAKHETTQAQWRRLSRGEDRAYYDVAYNAQFPASLPQLTEVNPMESVSWLRAVEVLRRWGLVLPTEAQWEYACRAGTDTTYFFGGDYRGFSAYGNGADDFARRYVRGWGVDMETEWDDGHILHAPVGSFLPNPWGLHDVLGNVAEWCADAECTYDVPPRPGDGLRGDPARLPDVPLRIHRGGKFQSGRFEVRCADRGENTADVPSNWVGVRAARRVLAP